MPHLAEEIYTNLSGNESVHLSEWPKVDQNLIDMELVDKTALVKEIVTLGHAVRDKAKIKVRQPLSKVQIALPVGINKDYVLEQKEVLLEELNVKELEILENADQYLKTVLKVNAKLIGPKFGKDVQEIIKLSKNGDFKLNGNTVKIGNFDLVEGEFEIGFEALEGNLNIESKNGISVLLDTVVTDSLYQEGLARDVVRSVQELRKEADLNVIDRIKLNLSIDKEFEQAIVNFSDYIKKETLAEELFLNENDAFDFHKEIEIESKVIKVSINKA